MKFIQVGTTVICFGVAVFVAGCGSSSTSKDNPAGSHTVGSVATSKLKSITMIDPAPGQPAWDAIVKCFRSQAAAKGVKAVITGPPGASAYNLQSLLELTQQAVASGTSAIALTTSFSAPSFDPVIKQAKAKGVFIGTMESGDASPGRNFDVGLDIMGYARDAANYVGKMSRPKNVAIVAQNLTGTPKIFIDTFKAQLARYPDAKYVTQVLDNADTTKDADLVSNLLSSHPETSIIVSANPASTAPIATAIKEAKAEGRVHLLAITRDAPGLAALEGGTAEALYVQRLCDVGTSAVDSFVALSQGKPVRSLIPVSAAYVTRTTNSKYDSAWG